jgi:hypothetical protein
MYKNYHIEPFGFYARENTHHFWHDDYDGAPDSLDNRCGYGTSVEDCKKQIDEQIEENEQG